MDFSVSAIVRKMILTIAALSFLLAVGVFVFFRSVEAIPFIVGVLLAMGLNILKVFWLKKTITKIADMDSPQSAKVTYQIQYFLRLVVTAGILLIAALAPDTIVNLIGVVLGILVFPISMQFTRFFIPPDTVIPTKAKPDFGQDTKEDA